MSACVADFEDPIELFLRRHGWADAERTPLAGDASARQYLRLVRPGGGTAILALSPFAEVDLVPFVRIGRWLTGLGVSVPRILADAGDEGLLLLEDLGDQTFAWLLEAGAEAESLYALAVDLLVDLHRRAAGPALASVPLPVYDAGLFIRQVMLFADAYAPVALERPLRTRERWALERAWWQVVPAACAGPHAFMHRDFHVDNLMRLDGRSGLAACGVLDFQSAGIGPVAYDLVSLIEDARRDIAPELARAMVARYRSACPGLDAAGFAAALDVLGAIRHARVLGIFTRIALREGKRRYLGHMPRVWRLLEGRLASPALAPVRAWFDAHLPPERRASLVIPETVPWKVP